MKYVPGALCSIGFVGTTFAFILGGWPAALVAFGITMVLAVVFVVLVLTGLVTVASQVVPSSRPPAPPRRSDTTP